MDLISCVTAEMNFTPCVMSLQEESPLSLTLCMI